MGPIETTLRAAHVLLEKGWTQGVHARDVHGRSCYVLDGEAICFCYIGAIMRASSDSGARSVGFIHAHSAPMAEIGIVRWQDATERTQAEVLAENQRMINRAAEMGV